MLLIAGGNRDPNIQWLIAHCHQVGIEFIPFLTHEESSSAIVWDMQKDKLRIDGTPLKINAAFIRRDVFHGDEEKGNTRSTIWYELINGWLANKDQVKILNRDYLGRYTNKLQVLNLAKTVGLEIPKTNVSNQISVLRKDSKSKIVKPVLGGGYCQEAKSLIKNTDTRNGNAAMPAIIQQKVVGPDIRIYKVGKKHIGFLIKSENLDYRVTKEREIENLEVLPTSIVNKLNTLMTRMGLNWGAADFKYDKEEDKYYFLEVNSNPMFSVFDRIANGKISDAIVKYLRN